MMRHWIKIVFLVTILLPAACGRKDNPQDPSVIPAIRITVTDVDAFRATVDVASVQTARLRYGVGSTESDARKMEDYMTTPNEKTAQFSLTLQDLQPDTDYIFCAQGIGPGGEEGNVATAHFTTPAGPDGLYSWERGREKAPDFKAISLITRGQHNYNPPLWTVPRFAPHVSYTDASGEHWLFDAFLCTEGYDGPRGLTMSIQSDGHRSAIKASWEELLDYWFANNGALEALDDAVAAVASRLGTPPTPRYVVISVPDPIMFQVFSDRSSSTTYWGSLDGEVMDFSRLEHQEKAYRWFMDQCRERFRTLQPRYLEQVSTYSRKNCPLPSVSMTRWDSPPIMRTHGMPPTSAGSRFCRTRPVTSRAAGKGCTGFPISARPVTGYGNNWALPWPGCSPTITGIRPTNIP